MTSRDCSSGTPPRPKGGVPSRVQSLHVAFPFGHPFDRMLPGSDAINITHLTHAPERGPPAPPVQEFDSMSYQAHSTLATPAPCAPDQRGPFYYMVLFGSTSSH